MADDHIDIRDDARPLIPTWDDALATACIQMASSIVQSGHTKHEATSIVANMMIKTAWALAGMGAVEDGKRPRPQAFLFAVDRAIKSIEFRDENNVRVENDETGKVIIDTSKHPLPAQPEAWYYGSEELHGPFDTKEDAAEEARDGGIGVTNNGDGTCRAVVSRCRHKQVNLAEYFNAERFLEDADERMDTNDEGSDEYGDKSPLLEVGPDDQAALEIAVREAIWLWQRDRNLPLKSYWMDILEDDVGVALPMPTDAPAAPVDTTTTEG